MQQAAAGNAVFEESEISREALGFEFMLNALRLTGGFESRLFAERTGLPLQVVERAIANAEARGLLTCDHRMIQPTALGQRFLNDLQQIFLPEED
jgi:oxygen-independent coproporphyrinogen-3 oxidase